MMITSALTGVPLCSKPSNSDSQVPSAVKLLDPNETFAYNRDYKGLEGVAIAKHVPADEAFECAAPRNVIKY